MHQISLLALIEKGSAAIIILVICSAIVLAVILERMWTISRAKRVPRDLMRRIETMLRSGNRTEAIDTLDEIDSTFSRVLRASISSKDELTKEEREELLAGACDEEISNLSRPVGILGTMGNIAPFIGLFGTVIGIMRAFADVAQKGAGADAVYRGISEALVATALGLLVGIIAVVTNNWLLSVIDSIRISLEKYATEWSHRMKNIKPTAPAAQAEPAAPTADVIDDITE